MKSSTFTWAARIIPVFLLAIGMNALAQAPSPEHLSGIISDYTPVNTAANPAGPWEMRGHWSLDLKGNSGKADFSAYMAMELSDYWLFTTNSDATNPAIRSPHTHHIVMTDATVSSDPTDTGRCPANNPANTVRFVVNGTASFISGNGNPAPFEKKGPSTLQVCISGGTDGQSEVDYSNLALVFGGPATGHFGQQAIHGAVRLATSDRDPEGAPRPAK